MKRLILLWACLFLPVQAFPVSYNLGSKELGVSGYLEGLGVYALDDDTQEEDPSALFSLSAKSDFARWGAFKIT